MSVQSSSDCIFHHFCLPPIPTHSRPIQRHTNKAAKIHVSPIVVWSYLSMKFDTYPLHPQPAKNNPREEPTKHDYCQSKRHLIIKKLTHYLDPIKANPMVTTIKCKNACQHYRPPTPPFIIFTHILSSPIHIPSDATQTKEQKRITVSAKPQPERKAAYVAVPIISPLQMAFFWFRTNLTLWTKPRFCFKSFLQQGQPIPNCLVGGKYFNFHLQSVPHTHKRVKVKNPTRNNER